MNAADTARTHADAARLGLTLTAERPLRTIAERNGVTGREVAVTLTDGSTGRWFKVSFNLPTGRTGRYFDDAAEAVAFWNARVAETGAN